MKAQLKFSTDKKIPESTIQEFFLFFQALMA